MAITMERPVSPQMALPGIDSKSEQLVEDARIWVNAHPQSFERFIRLGKREMRRMPSGKASPNKVREQMREGSDALGGALMEGFTHPVSIPNAITPVLARMAMKRDPGVVFNVSRSMVDGLL